MDVRKRGVMRVMHSVAACCTRTDLVGDLAGPGGLGAHVGVRHEELGALPLRCHITERHENTEMDMDERVSGRQHIALHKGAGAGASLLHERDPRTHHLVACE